MPSETPGQAVLLATNEGEDAAFFAGDFEAAESRDVAGARIVEAPADELDVRLYGDGGDYIDENGNGQWDEGETILVTGERTEDRLVPTWDLWGSGGGGSGGGGDSGGGGGGGGTNDDDECGQDDVPPWTNPDQPTRNTRASDAITITVDGNNVTITGNISFEGAGAGAHTDGRLLAHLNSTWSGQFGEYSVTTNMTIGTGGLIANVSGSPLGQQYAELGGTNIWTLTLDGASPETAAYTMKKFAHEFGHSLGLINLYDEKGGGYAPGYENNVMSDVNVKPTWQNIRDLLAQKAKGCSGPA